jgi:hypothetical protein
MPWSDFLAQAKKRYDGGYRVVVMNAVAVLDNLKTSSRRALFTATWRNDLGSGALYFVPPSQGPAYAAAFKKHFDNGLRTVAFGAYTTNGQMPIYVGAVRGGLGEPGEYSSPALKWNEFLAEHKSRVSKGYRLIDISVYMQFVKID